MSSNKFNAKKVTVDGMTFDSGKEYRRWHELQLLQLGGEIRGLERQITLPLTIEGRPIKIRSQGYPNGRKCTYTADFAYFEGEKRIYEDSKGKDTEASRLRRAVVEAIYNVEIRIT